jgi:DNA-binding transcriptional regulator YiaG
MRTNLDVQALRAKLNLTQAGLADLAMVDIATVWRWENKGVPEKGTARAFLELLADDADRSVDVDAGVSR